MGSKKKLNRKQHLKIAMPEKVIVIGRSTKELDNFPNKILHTKGNPQATNLAKSDNIKPLFHFLPLLTPCQSLNRMSFFNQMSAKTTIPSQAKTQIIDIQSKGQCGLWVSESDTNIVVGSQKQRAIWLLGKPKWRKGFD